ncbi:MAG: DotA/TraY family protein [Bdellovibrionales bacterium]
MKTNTKKAIKYSVLPGFIPRIMTLATSGFSTLAFYIALVYNIVKLIPDGHPYLNRTNIGKYGIRHVIMAAADNLVFKRKNTDQIIIFFTILTGLAIIIIQIILLGLAFFASHSAFALGFPVEDLFLNPNATTGSAGPEQDLAFIILDRVFGMVGIYESCVSMLVACESSSGVPSIAAIPAYPYPFHDALHTMLRFYSLGIIVVAAMLFVYFTITVVGETAATGTPFGQRFNRAWAPVRFVLFFAMIIPLNLSDNNNGLNGAQMLTFWVAKHGSNFASNGWAYFNTTLSTGTFLGDQSNLVAIPNRPEMGNLNQFILTAKVCAMVERTKHGNDVQAYVVRPPPPDYVTGAPAGSVNPNANNYIGTPYGTALSFSYNGNINIRFGTVGTGTEYEGYAGQVFPHCGDITVLTTDYFEPGSLYIAEEYYKLVDRLWTDTTLNEVAQCIARSRISDYDRDPTCADVTYEPNNEYVEEMKSIFDAFAQASIDNGVAQQQASGNFLVPPEIIEKGWAGAAIWFNRIAEMNGAVIDASLNIPRPTLYPYSMELTYERRLQENLNITGENKYNPILADGTAMELPGDRQETYNAIYYAHNFWQERNAADTAETESTGNAVLDVINLILGTSGVFDMRKNVDINPLAQLTAIGKGMMEATIRNTAIASAGYVGGGLEAILGDVPAELAKVLSGFMFSVIISSIGIAVILYYVLPFLPFIYFLFAVSGWVKSIFEAIVAMPLWALAHIRIDGEGIPGQDAANGYFLLCEIFLRPILILFGLLASISIFSALVFVLNSIFDLLVANTAGFGVEGEIKALPTQIAYYRGPIDQFFFTAMYAIICYLVGMSCFKLIDLIPNNILRWMGSNAATFQENAGDPAGQLTNNVYRGSVLVSNQVQGATQGNLQAIAGG